VGGSPPTIAAPRAGLPLVETKLVPARARPGSLLRGRLLGELDRLSSAALTLVDAPVGFGKSVLAQSWCRHTESGVAWVSLERGDDDPVRMWTYIATSVDRVRPGLGRLALARLRTPGVRPETVADDLVNGVNAYGRPLAIVLDDLHTLADEACLGSLLHAIEHLPPHARVIATTRADPALPLGRLRGRGVLGELRAQELAFTVEEARELLVENEGIALGDGDVELLVERTEGWPAGLYLAALWLRDLDDPSARVRDFHGDHRHVVDYLTDEVLDALDGDTRRFLLESSILGRFTAPLCDAVLGRSDSAERLREIEHSNGFLMRLDAPGGWYRYHHLFGELLQLELAGIDAAAPARLHLAASDWFREHGLVAEALEHASAAGEQRRVATILVDRHRDLIRTGQAATVLRWCGELPDELMLELPDIPVAAAIAAGLAGRSEHDRRRFVAIAEQARDETPERWGAYNDAALGIAKMTWVEHDLGEAVRVGRRAADVARADVPEVAVAALASLGFLHFLDGDLGEARALAEETLERPEVAERPHGFVYALATRALVESEAGDPETAEEDARRAIGEAEAAGIAELASGGVARVALAAALAAQGRLAEAEREAVLGEGLSRHPEPEAAHLLALLVLAGIRARRGRLVRASADLATVRRALVRFVDAGRLPALADAVERMLADADMTPVDGAPSAAELSVLQLLATDLSRREIGARLFLSVNTVKTHTRSLYRKLGASSREEAVARAAALGLLDASDSPG
jgi:LuxR family transcriptional regulator, maltose regulon positive regulatory protein